MSSNLFCSPVIIKVVKTCAWQRLCSEACGSGGFAVRSPRRLCPPPRDPESPTSGLSPRSRGRSQGGTAEHRLVLKNSSCFYGHRRAQLFKGHGHLKTTGSSHASRQTCGRCLRSRLACLLRGDGASFFLPSIISICLQDHPQQREDMWVFPPSDADVPRLILCLRPLSSALCRDTLWRSSWCWLPPILRSSHSLSRQALAITSPNITTSPLCSFTGPLCVTRSSCHPFFEQSPRLSLVTADSSPASVATLSLHC